MSGWVDPVDPTRQPTREFGGQSSSTAISSEDVAETVYLLDQLGADGVQLFVLASSRETAGFAGRQGLGLAVAGHVAPAGMDVAISAYREVFRPRQGQDQPRVLVCLPIVVADSDDEAQWWFRSVHRRYLDRLRTGGSPMLPPDEADLDLLRRELIVILGSEVNDQIANLISAQLLYLEGEDDSKDIWLYINSPGGSVTAGLAIYDTMNFINPDVGTICMGLAASMGQFLLCAGAPGKRYALPSARIMMHQPSGGFQGQAADIKIQAEQMVYIKQM